MKTQRHLLIKTHQWFVMPGVWSFGVKLTQHRCAKCGKTIVGKHPSATERCYR